MSDPITLAQRLSYTVQPGDTVSEIAQRFQVPPEEIVAASRLANPNLIRPGQQLNVPQFPVSTFPPGYVVNQDAPGNWSMPTYRGPTDMPPPEPQPEAPQDQGAGGLAKLLMQAHQYIDPTQYLGGYAGTALAGLPAGRVVSGARALASRIAEASPEVAQVADAAFSPTQWGRMTGSAMRENLLPAERGFVNVADDAVANTTGGVLKPLPEKPAQSLAQELQQIHRDVLKRMPPKVRKINTLTGEALAKRKAYYRALAKARKAGAPVDEALTTFDDPLYFAGGRQLGRTLPQ